MLSQLQCTWATLRFSDYLACRLLFLRLPIMSPRSSSRGVWSIGSIGILHVEDLFALPKRCCRCCRKKIVSTTIAFDPQKDTETRISHLDRSARKCSKGKVRRRSQKGIISGDGKPQTLPFPKNVSAIVCKHGGKTCFACEFSKC